MPLTFLYNDPDIFAVYKPAGIHSVRLPTGGGASIADELLKACPELALSSKSPGDAGLIHRLDEGTSGVLLGAKRRDVWEKLFDQAMAGEVQKTYALLVEGRFESARTISSFIGSPHRGAKKVKVYEKQPPDWARALSGTTTFTPTSFIERHNVTIL